ncbi:hypothetical protein IAT40_000191 [Kwoniella sp. CBS 6097]
MTGDRSSHSEARPLLPSTDLSRGTSSSSSQDNDGSTLVPTKLTTPTSRSYGGTDGAEDPGSTGTVVATPRSDAPAATLASSFTSVKLDKAADIPTDSPLISQAIPRVGQSDHPPDRIDGFSHLQLDGPSSRQLYTERQLLDRGADVNVKLDPISLSILSRQEDPQATPNEPGHGRPRFVDPTAIGSIHFRLDSSDCYDGHLWTIYRGKLAFNPITAGPSYQEIPVVLKLKDFTIDAGMSSPEALGKQWADALHKDKVLHSLYQLQGGAVPNYYGLYSYSLFRGQPTIKSPPEVLVMIMEDIGEQKYPRKHWQWGSDQKRGILQAYEDLHHRGRTVHSGLPFDFEIHHILERTTKAKGDSHRFALVDFQKAASLKGVADPDLPTKLGFEDWGLMDHLGYGFARGSDLRLYDAQGNVICGYSAPWSMD